MKIMKTAIRLLTVGCLLLGTAWSTSGLADIPRIQHWTTENGARVYFVAAPELPMMDARVVFAAGSARDGEQPGLAMLTNGLLAEGAGGLSADRIVEGFADLGAEFGNSALRDMAWVELRSLTDPELLEPALELVNTILARPDFPDRAFERERNRALASLDYEKQSPDSLASKTFYRHLYGDHPYGSPPSGTEQSLRALKVEDLRAFHRQYYVAANAVVAIVGDLDQAAARRVADTLTAGLPAGQPAPDPGEVAELAEAEHIHLEHPSTQTHILWGQPGISRKHPDYFPLYVGNHIFGGSVSLSRLMHEIREERGLAYSVYSYFIPMSARGPFLVNLQTRNEQAKQALEVVEQTLREFIANGPSDEELELAKRNLTGGFPLDIDSNKKIVNYIAMIGFYRLPLNHLDTLTDKIQAVTREQIRDAFQRRLHPDRMILVTVGQEGK